jgi:putative membrane protein
MYKGLAIIVQAGLVGAAPVGQYQDHYGMMGNWWWIWFTGIGGFIVLVLVIYLLAYTLRSGGRGARAPEAPCETPLDILKKRYAKGEITREEYEQMRRDLES